MNMTENNLDNIDSEKEENSFINLLEKDIKDVIILSEILNNPNIQDL